MNLNSLNINQLPGLYVVFDLQSRVLAANNAALRWTGFKSEDQMIGTTYSDMPCKASEQHENFVLQDKLILNNQNGYGKIIGLYCYDNNDWKIVLAEKFPIQNEQAQTIALASYISDLTYSNVIDVSKFVKLTHLNGKSFGAMKQSGFLISDNQANAVITRRQEECLFFLIRGKTCKEISSILDISVRTVEQFVEQLKNIFICDTKSKLIEKAIHEGYLSIIPRSLYKTIHI